MNHQFMNLLKAFFFLWLLVASVTGIDAQIAPPGYEREVQAMEERNRTNILDRDSVMLIDTIVLFDPSTYEETIKVVSSKLSWRDYMMHHLGITSPDNLLNGAPYPLTDPRTYEQLIIQWNAGTGKIDTIRQ